MRTPFCFAVMSAIRLVLPAHATSDIDLAQIRAQLQHMKETYEQRIAALETRLAEAEKTASRPTPADRSEPRVDRTGTTTATSAGAFNPAIYAVLQGAYSWQSQRPNDYVINGFVPSGDLSPGKRGFSLAESELGLSATIFDNLHANLILALSPDNEVEVEEAYAFFSGLAGGVRPKFGRFLSSVGYLNDHHQHSWDFYDAPLPYQAFFGGQFRSDGLQLKWVAPSASFFELGGEIGDGASFPGNNRRNNNGVGSFALYAHLGGDIDTSSSWRAGVSYLGLKPRDREYVQVDSGGADSVLGFSGRSQLAIADFVWKYAPNGNPGESHFKLQGEYFWRKEHGNLTYDLDGTLGLTNTDHYSSRQRGGYLQTVYQFMPQWRAGLRYDQLDPGSSRYGSNGAFLDGSDFTPKRYTAMVDYTSSEYGRFRLQFQQAKVRPEVNDHQVFLQYILTMGAHGAHRY